MKVTSRDILDILRRFEVANSDNVPRHVEMLRITNPTAINTLAAFRFQRHQFYVMFDEIVADDPDSVVAQIRLVKPDLKGELYLNPTSEQLTYALPFKGHSCYLFEALTEKRRLDLELASRYPDTSRATWQKYIDAGYVSVNGSVALSSKQSVGIVDKISVSLPEQPDYSKNELPIVYMDDNVIVINKPTGVLTHSKGAMNNEFTVADFFRRYTNYKLDTNRPGIVHRLDRDTSGVLIGARNQETAELLQRQFADRKTKKTYYAILNGIPKLDKANIDLPIGRNLSSPSTFRVDARGKSANTRYETIDTNDAYTLVKLQPTTGRTHQLRVHMQYIKTPILGDRIYGKPHDRLYLHAYSLEVTIPNGDRRIFTAPLPEDFKKYFPKVNL